MHAALVALAVSLGLVVAPSGLEAAGAAFSADTANPVNALAADRLQPPSALSVVPGCVGGSSVVFRAASSAAGQNPLTVPTPPGATLGDVLIAQIATRGAPALPTAPSGWTVIRRDTSARSDGTIEVTSALFVKVATAGEASSATFTFSGSSVGQTVGGIAAYRGVDTSSPVDVSGVRTGSSATASTPSVVTTSANDVLVHLLAKRQEALPAPDGSVQRWGLVSGNGTATAGATAAEESTTSPGATTPRDSRSPSTFPAEWIVQTVALRPLAGTPSAALTWAAGPSSWASGYQLDRVVDGAVESTRAVTPVGTTNTTETPLVNGTTYTFRLTTAFRAWRSTPVSVTFTPTC